MRYRFATYDKKIIYEVVGRQAGDNILKALMDFHMVGGSLSAQGMVAVLTTIGQKRLKKLIDTHGQQTI